MKRQAIVNTVWAHFIVNGQPQGWDDTIGECEFHCADGSSCSIGVLDPEQRLKGLDSGVNEVLMWRSLGLALSEWPSAPALLAAFLDSIGMRTQEDLAFMREIQVAHDLAAGYAFTGESWLDEFESRMRALCESWRLQIPAH